MLLLASSLFLLLNFSQIVSYAIPIEQGFPMLPFPCMLAGFAGHVLSMFAVFADFACKNSKHIPFVSAVGAKSAEKGKALGENSRDLSGDETHTLNTSSLSI